MRDSAEKYRGRGRVAWAAAVVLSMTGCFSYSQTGWEAQGAHFVPRSTDTVPWGAERRLVVQEDAKGLALQVGAAPMCRSYEQGELQVEETRFKKFSPGATHLITLGVGGGALAAGGLVLLDALEQQQEEEDAAFAAGEEPEAEFVGRHVHAPP